MEISKILERWQLETKGDPETKRAYKRAVEKFMIANKMTAQFDAETITHKHYEKFLIWMTKKEKNDNTRSIYSSGVSKFLKYLIFHDLAVINMEKIKYARDEILSKNVYKLKIYSEKDLDEILASAEECIEQLFENENAKLRAFRDRAFLLTLAGTGLRVSEACNLKRGDIDMDKRRAVIIGKGNKQGVIRFSTQSINAVKEYLHIRSKLDGGTGKSLLSLPVFAQHSKSSSDRVDPISTKTGRDIIRDWVIRVLGDEKQGTITPHTFRHYFVTTVVQMTGNVKLAKEMARHSNITVTDKYAQLNDSDLDKAHKDIFG